MSAEMHWRYRLAQGLRRIEAQIAPSCIDDDLARTALPAAAYRLFREMSAGDRAHALCVLSYLRDQAPQVGEVLTQAALLHDVGKACAAISLFHRSIIVMLEQTDPQRLEALAQAAPSKPGYPYYVHLHHAEMGARKCAQAGCSPAVVALVRYHESDPSDLEDPELHQALIRLQKADDAC